MTSATPSKDGALIAPRNPTLSVIITAFERRQFIARAVRSVLRQTLPSETYEIVLVTDFLLPEVDASVREHGGVVLRYGSTVFGETIARACEIARGEVLVFLEDDDEFEPTKLERVAHLFAAAPHLDFYHHEYIEVDPDGAPRSGGAYELGRARRGPSASQRWDGARKVELVGRIYPTNPAAHLSCMAVRREVLRNVLPELRRVPFGVDVFIFVAALATPGSIEVDPAPLTRYRRHGQNFSETLASEPSRYEDLVAGTVVLEGAIHSLLEREGTPALRVAVERLFRVHTLWLALTRKPRRRKELARALLGLWRSGQPLASEGNRRNVFEALVALAWPGRARFYKESH